MLMNCDLCGEQFVAPRPPWFPNSLMGHICHSELYNQLLTLTQANEVFYYKDHILDDVVYRIFNYRLAQYGDFQAPSALWCRGTMFEINSEGNMLRLACRPMPKFFNFGEDPTVKSINPEDIEQIQLKMDGSLISTYLHKGELRLKTKGSLDSQQALDAMAWFKGRESVEEMMWNATKHGYTVNFEWISPSNQVVIYYEESKLIYLNDVNKKGEVRSAGFSGLLAKLNCPNVDGDLSVNSPLIAHHNHNFTGFNVNDIKPQKQIEGYVVKLKCGTWLKLKTDEYLLIHKAKDSVLSDRGLYEAILIGTIDDLIPIMKDDMALMERVAKMRNLIMEQLNKLTTIVSSFYNSYRWLDRKSYAIKAKELIDPLYFGLVMIKYLDKPLLTTEFLLKNWDKLGIKEKMEGK